MLSDVLGIIVAFVSIILILSILVTALVQFVQAVLRLRARNLKKGLAELIDMVTDRGVATKTPKEQASDILNAPNVALMNRVREPETSVERAARWLQGPNVSWIEPKELPGAIEAQPQLKEELTSEQKGEFVEAFENSQPLLQRRFQLLIRLWTFAIALIVAAGFQVGTPQLLKELADDAERRNAIVAGAGRLLEGAAEDIGRLEYEDAAIEGLQVLQARHPELRDRIDEASGIGTTRGAIVEELGLALEGIPERALIMAEYEALLDRLSVEQLETAREVTENARQQLGEYGVFLWSKGWDFYFENADVGIGTTRFDAIIGVLITAILLTLGAPFWFEMLRNVVRLRDVLAGTAGTSSKPVEEPKSEETENGIELRRKAEPGT